MKRPPGSHRDRSRRLARASVEVCRQCVGAVRRWSRTRAGRLVFLTTFVGSVLVFAFAIGGVPHILGGTRVALVVGPERADLPPIGTVAWANAFALATGTDLTAGNGIELLSNGDETFPRLWADLRQARRSVTIQVYFAAGGEVMDSVLAILSARARAGVRVFFLYDAFGSADLPERYIQSLTLAGVQTAAFRPLRWYSLDRAYHRSHTRGIVIDGEIGYTGGFGFADRWLGSGESPDQWRETNVRFRGPAARHAQTSFVHKWAEVTGTIVTGEAFLGPPDAVGGGTYQAAFLHSPPAVGGTVAERFLALAIASARHRLYLTNPYFVPSPSVVDALVAAARRGVDVRILTNGAQSDVKVTWLAGRSQYDELLAAGVGVWEYRPAVLHAKTFVVDGSWLAVGTINIDARSLAFNNEVSLTAVDSGLGAAMDSLFLADQRRAIEIHRDTFGRRSRLGRLLERAAYALARLL